MGFWEDNFKSGASSSKPSSTTSATTPSSGSQTPSPKDEAKELSLWDRKYAQDASKFTENPILLKLLNGGWKNQSYDDLHNKLNTYYKKDFKVDYKLLKDAEIKYLKNQNKAELRNSIKKIDDVRFSEYVLLTKYCSGKEYVSYGLFFILISLVLHFITRKLIKSISIKPMDSNVGTLGKSVDDSKSSQPKTIHLKRTTLQTLLSSLVLGFLVVSLLQLFQLANIKEMFYDLNLSYNVISINNIGYPDGYIKLKSATTFFGNSIEIPTDLFKVENSWKGIYSKDFFDIKFKMLVMIIENAFKDAFYWFVISFSIFALALLQKWLKMNVRIRIS